MGNSPKFQSVSPPELQNWESPFIPSVYMYHGNRRVIFRNSGIVYFTLYNACIAIKGSWIGASAKAFKDIKNMEKTQKNS
jgi:hypothetical protein